MSPDERSGLVALAQKIGIVAGAMIAVGTLSAWILPRIWHAALTPAFAYTDAKFTEASDKDAAVLMRLESQQIDMLEVLAFKAGSPERVRNVRLVKAKWQAALDSTKLGR